MGYVKCMVQGEKRARLLLAAAVLCGIHAGPAVADEIGADFRISVMGDDSETDSIARGAFGAARPSVAYNNADNRYLVVWFGDTDEGELVDFETEIWGRLVDGTTGAPIGGQFRISDMGSVDGDVNFGVLAPAVAYNSTENEFLVVWGGDDDTGDLADFANEIFGQRIDGTTGTELGTNDFRISDMGPDDTATNFSASNPHVAYDSVNNEYLVVWNGINDAPDMINREQGIYGQRLDGETGAEVGTNDFPIVVVVLDGISNTGYFIPRAAHNATQNEYLVVWKQQETATDIFGRRVGGGTGSLLGDDAVRISDMGASNDDSNFIADNPDVAWHPTLGEYLVVWQGDDDTPPLVDNELEVFGQRIDGVTGTEAGLNDFRISRMGPDGSTSFFGALARVAANSEDAEYLVVWSGDDNTPPLVDNESEVYAQRVAVTGDVLGLERFRISDMGPDGDAAFVGNIPSVAYGSGAPGYLVVWNGDDDTAPLVDNETEIFGQLIAASQTVWVDFAASSGTEDGSFAHPFNTFSEGIAAVTPGGTIALVESATAEAPTINKRVRMLSIGRSRIGKL